MTIAWRGKNHIDFNFFFQCQINFETTLNVHVQWLLYWALKTAEKSKLFIVALTMRKSPVSAGQLIDKFIQTLQVKREDRRMNCIRQILLAFVVCVCGGYGCVTHFGELWYTFWCRTPFMFCNNSTAQKAICVKQTFIQVACGSKFWWQLEIKKVARGGLKRYIMMQNGKN